MGAFRIHHSAFTPALRGAQRGASVILYSLFWYHGARTLINGQTAGAAALLMIAALWAIDARRDALAGLLLALSTNKPQMPFILIPVVMLWAIPARRWKLMAWSAGWMAALLGVSLALIPDWPLKMAAQIQSYTTYTDIGSPVSIVMKGVFGVTGAGRAVEWVLSGGLLLYLAWEVWRARGREGRAFQWLAALAIVVTNLVAFRTATTNYVVMLPAALLIFKAWEERWGGRGRAAALLVMLAYFVGEWWLFLATVKGNVEQVPVYLPLPFLLLFGLLAARRQFAQATTVA